MTTSAHPIRLFLHGFTKPINNSIEAICAYPDAPKKVVLIKGSERDMLYQQHHFDDGIGLGYEPLFEHSAFLVEEVLAPKWDFAKSWRSSDKVCRLCA